MPCVVSHPTGVVVELDLDTPRSESPTNDLVTLPKEQCVYQFPVFRFTFNVVLGYKISSLTPDIEFLPVFFQ